MCIKMAPCFIYHISGDFSKFSNREDSIVCDVRCVLHTLQTFRHLMLPRPTEDQEGSVLDSPESESSGEDAEVSSDALHDEVWVFMKTDIQS